MKRGEKVRRIIMICSLVVFLGLGCVCAIVMYESPLPYDGSKTDAYQLYTNPTQYDTTDADGVADIMVKENLDKTRSQNAVTAIVFDYRGYDTMGESFILLTAISGSMAILRAATRKKGDDSDEVQKKSH
jgi:hypothetical protein